MNRERLSDAFKTLADLVFINFLFLSAVLLGAFFTFGAAYKALFSVMFQLMDKRRATYVAKAFWRAFKEDFWYTTFLWIVIAAIGAGIYAVWTLAMSMNQVVVAGFATVSGFFLISFTMMLFPMHARFQAKSRLQMIKNAVYMVFGNPLTLLWLFGGLAFGFLLFEWWSGTILFSFGLVAWINAIHLNRAFQRFIPEDAFPQEE